MEHDVLVFLLICNAMSVLDKSLNLSNMTKKLYFCSFMFEINIELHN